MLAAVGTMNKKNDKIELAQCRRFMYHLCDALNFLHSRGAILAALISPPAQACCDAECVCVCGGCRDRAS